MHRGDAAEDRVLEREVNRAEAVDGAKVGLDGRLVRVAVGRARQSRSSSDAL